MMRRRSITALQVAAQKRTHAMIDDQPHMTLSPEKGGKLWHGGQHKGHPAQTPTLLSAHEAFFQGFHAGAQWGYRIARTRSRRRDI